MLRVFECEVHCGFLYVQASDSTSFEWCPDGVHVVTATTAPRLREGNGYVPPIEQGTLWGQRKFSPLEGTDSFFMTKNSIMHVHVLCVDVLTGH